MVIMLLESARAVTFVGGSGRAYAAGTPLATSTASVPTIVAMLRAFLMAGLSLVRRSGLAAARSRCLGKGGADEEVRWRCGETRIAGRRVQNVRQHSLGRSARAGAVRVGEVSAEAAERRAARRIASAKPP
jgi:hypothetical protein